MARQSRRGGTFDRPVSAHPELRLVNSSLPTWAKILRYSTLVVLAVTVVMAVYVAVVVVLFLNGRW